MTASSGVSFDRTSKITAELKPLSLLSSRRFSFSAFHIFQRSAISDLWSIIDGFLISAENAFTVTPISPKTGYSMAWKRPSCSGSKSTWIIGLDFSIPVCFENELPSAIIRSHSFINQLAIGVPERPKTPAAKGWLSGICPLALKVVAMGTLRRSANAIISPIAAFAP